MTLRHTLKLFALAATPLLLTAALAIGTAAPAQAESASELLERGLYTEQSVGDLTAAMTLYQQVVDDERANRPHVAQAQLRLALCHRKQGDETAAMVALERLIHDYSDQEAVVAQARLALAEGRSTLDLDPVPWHDGESLEYRMSLPTGKFIGTMHLGAQATRVDGVEAWSLELRRFVRTAADNNGISRVLVDAQTQRPIQSTVRHGVLGNADASYGADGVEITSGGQIQTVEGSVIFDNEQSIHLMRMLPLAEGDSTTLQFLPTWTGSILEVELEVTGRESCQLPTGEGECLVLASSIGQTTWISTDPKRYPVRIEGGGVVIELASIKTLDPQAPVDFGIEDFGFTGQLPADWQAHEVRNPDRPRHAMMRFLDDEALSISSLEIDRCPGQCPALQDNAERELAGAQRRFEGFEMRQDSWQQRTLDGRPAISFVADFLRGEVPWVQYRLYTFTDDLRFEFIFRTPKDRFDDQVAAFDTIAESLEAE